MVWFECCSVSKDANRSHQIETVANHDAGGERRPSFTKKSKIKSPVETPKGSTRSTSKDKPARREVRIMSVHNQPLQLLNEGALDIRKSPPSVERDKESPKDRKNGVVFNAETSEKIPVKAMIKRESDGLMPYTRKSVRAMTRRKTNAEAAAANAAAAASDLSHGNGSVMGQGTSSGSNALAPNSRKRTLKEGMEELRALSQTAECGRRPAGRKHTSVVLERAGPVGQDSSDAPHIDISHCVPVTRENAEIMMKVVRGRDWKWGEEDGGPGKWGTVIDVNKDDTLSIYWHSSNQMKSHYRYIAAHDLSVAPKHSVKPRLNKRDSQMFFCNKDQTVIIFDWDDTLFPTTYIREDLQLNHCKPLKDNNLDEKQQVDIGKKLACCAALVCELLQLASEYGQVILVTLAQAPWIKESCRNFYPGVWAEIKELNIPVIYAQEGQHIDYNKADMMSDDDVEMFWSRVKGKAISREVDKFYSQYEGQSWKNIISIGDSNFERLGTQGMAEDYAMKNIPDSVGPSYASLQAHVLGTGSQSVGTASLAAGTESEPIRKEMSFKGERNGHIFKVRPKTFKIVDDPELDELMLEIELLTKWVPLMVSVDDGFDINLEYLNRPELINEIDKQLRG